jgi:uncharacterized membrane-anchored protein YhcB (DUF1043 family)
MKKNLIVWIVYMSAAMVGVVLGDTLFEITKRSFFPNRQQQQHLCTCELCKVKRQLETCEVLDSIFTSKIEIEVNKK